MKEIYLSFRRHLLFVLFSIVGSVLVNSASAQNQNPGTYNFGKITRTYNSVANSTGAVPTLTGGTDEGFYNSLPIGFTFRYAGVDYTTAAASTNGWLTFGQNITDAAPTNNLATGTTRPVLAPLWDDLDMNAGGFYYLTQGSAPNRVFIAEWNNVRWSKASQAGIGCLSAQVRLFEGSNRIEFAYRQATGALSAPSASIGLAGVASGDFRSLDGPGTTPTASTATETTTINAKPATGQTYIFTPSAPTATDPSVSSYTYGAASGTYTSLQPNTPLSGGTDDDGYYNGLPIGFTFRLAGVDYTTASASTNGWMLLGQNIPNSVGQYGFVNSLSTTTTSSNGGLYPVLAPLWDDLTMGSGAFYYFTSGSAPNRVFTAEWYNAKWDYRASNPAISFQLRLYEGTNRIEYSYRQEAGTLTAPTASIGMALAAGANNFVSLSDASTAPTLNYATETTTIAAKPATGQVYAFTPDVARFVPSTGTFTSIAATGTVATRGGTANEGFYNGLPVGFTFKHAGGSYTTVSASTNGWLTFGQNIVDPEPANNLAATTNAALRPLLAPLWDNLSMQGGNLYYLTTGTAPNRVLTVEWNNARWLQSATAGVVSFQVKLYESSNRVDYVYRAEAGTPDGALTASIGVSPAAGVYVSLDGTGTAPVASSTVNTQSIAARPADGQTYSFFPLAQTLASSNVTYTNGIPLSGGTTDEGYYNGLPIGFAFNFDNGDHSTVSVSTNGWLTFDQNISNPVPANNLANGSVRPLLAPLWDDLSMAQGSVYYQTTGTAPYRVFTVEWYKALWEKGAAAPTLSFEVKLYETENRLEFVYRPEGGTETASAQSASIGIAGVATGSGNYLALNNTSTSALARNDANTVSLTGRPATAQIYGFSPGNINPLPVKLVSFVGKAHGLDADLSWKTAQELRNDHFELERSRDGREFAPVATIAGHGTTAQPQHYAYRDADALQPSRPTYYRLKQVDADGMASYSPIVVLTPTTAATLQLFPNPAHHAVQLLDAPAPTAQVLDLTGRLLRTLPSTGPLDLRGLATGVYLVQCGSQTARLVVE